MYAYNPSVTTCARDMLFVVRMFDCSFFEGNGQLKLCRDKRQKFTENGRPVLTLQGFKIH